MKLIIQAGLVVLFTYSSCAVETPPGGSGGFPKPYAAPCVERENIFEFTSKPAVKSLGNDRYEITFGVKGACDATVGIIDAEGKVVRHVASGVLGANAPAPFQKNNLNQKLVWNGKDDLDEYCKTPDKLRVRVMLGLKPEFDKRIGGTSGHNMPGYVFGMVVAEDGVYLFFKGGGSHGHLGLRKYDRDGKYVASLVPPPANLPQEKLAGYGYIEYEKGQRAVHGSTIDLTVSRDSYFLPTGGGKGVTSCQPVIIGRHLYYSNGGKNLLAGKDPSRLFYINTDGSSEVTGMKGVPFINGAMHLHPRFAASPDGKWIYAVTDEQALFRYPVDGSAPAAVFAGDVKAPGSDNAHFNVPSSVACDTKGRVWAGDKLNNRIQVFGPDGKFIRSLPVERPEVIGIHQKTGALYVKHAGRVQGKTIDRLTKFRSVDDPQEVFHMDSVPAGLMAVDSWSAKPRLWLSGSGFEANTGGSFGAGPGATVWEETETGWKKLLDFDEEARKDAGEEYMGRWSGSGGQGEKAVCDPVREVVYYWGAIFDLKTGKKLGRVDFHGRVDDFVFDKKGYLHAHANPADFLQAVLRYDPSKAVRNGDLFTYPEVPYDYGVEKMAPYNVPYRGVLPVRDQGGAKGFQEGIGVNMKGDVAVESNIYYVPKMEDLGNAAANAGVNEQLASGSYVGAAVGRWAQYVAAQQKAGEELYSVRKAPGIWLAGGTIWTFKANGELLKECAVTAGDNINNAQIDEDLAVYFVNSRPRIFNPDDGYFLAGKGGTFGLPEDKSNLNPFTGTLIKTKPDTYCKVLVTGAPVPMEPLPSRPPELMAIDWPDHYSKNSWAWVEGSEWLYAGASPIIHQGCACPRQLIHTDWYKRTYVPEAYRHSIGVVDANGNLVLHIGRYGNFDSGSGAQSKIPVGGDNIGITCARFLSGTDNYLAFDCWGERVMVLKLNYHAEETVNIAAAPAH